MGICYKNFFNYNMIKLEYLYIQKRTNKQINLTVIWKQYY